MCVHPSDEQVSLSLNTGLRINRSLKWIPCCFCIKNHAAQSVSFKSPLRARQNEVSGWWCHWKHWKQFPRGFEGYVSMEIPGSHLWLCHRHDSSCTSHLDWYTEQTHVYHAINTMLLELIVLQLASSKHAIFGMFVNWTIDGFFHPWSGSNMRENNLGDIYGLNAWWALTFKTNKLHSVYPSSLLFQICLSVDVFEC